MTHDFNGKVALVTGAGSGIGRAIALAFAASGAKTVVCDIDRNGGEETVEMISGLGGHAAFFPVDVSDGAQVAQMVHFAVDTFGKLDIACNNAGIAQGGKPVTDFSEEEWDRMMAINLKGVWLCMKNEIPELLKQPSSAIVNTASMSGLVGTAGSATYTTAKHGVIGLTKTAALDYATTGLRINAICPGVTRTPIMNAVPDIAEQMSQQIPMARLAEPSEIADAVLWLCSASASYVTGHSLVADGGYTVF